MIVSTKGRYALRAMIDLAENSTEGRVVLGDIAKRQGISEKYLEGILGTLSKGGLVSALRGRGGGYRLAREPERYTVASILRLTEKTLAPIPCLKNNENGCEQADTCRTLPVWKNLNSLINEYLESITLADFLKQGMDVDSLAI